MASSIENFWDSLSTDEANFVQTIMGELCDQAWSTSILASIRNNGGITQANKDRMFELRFGYALDRSAVVPRYEIPGEGGSTIDFGFTNNGQRWRVELVRLGETQAVKDATGSSVDSDGIPWTGRVLRTDEAYRAINPHRVVPTLVLEDGTAYDYDQIPALVERSAACFG